jgi:hypothetical protein
MLITFGQNFKVKWFTEKQFKIYQHVSLKGTISLFLGEYFLGTLSIFPKYLFFDKSFELEIWRLCYQHRFILLKKLSRKIQNISILGRVSKLAIVKLSLTKTHVRRFQIHFLRLLFWTWNLRHILPT